ncbi:MAG: bifunctional diaminohydroxyphosphoribosylaminopyrimidine deaminase/5-amino-6-(5-phosphoribosylamino)uracil reductase RibD [Myxococcota bacterium]
MSRRVSASDDTRFMGKAVAAARRGLGATYPNPCVGAVVVRGGAVVASARSRPTGGAHAEAAVLAKAGGAARGATLYVTLEPCRHHGRTPPCTDAIIAASIARVVVGLVDPASHVAGRGIRRLRRAGVIVDVGVAADACATLHEHYLHHVSTGRPFVTLKAGASLDGRIACPSGDSKWITSEAARRDVHRQRAQHHAIAVGAATVLADNPRLDVRLVRGVDPEVVVFDPQLRLGRPRVGALHVVRPGTLVVHVPRASAAARRRLHRAGVTLLETPADETGGSDVGAAMAALGERGLRSILVEGGGRLHGAFMAANAWQRWLLYQAPRILGDGIPVVGGVSWGTVRATPPVYVESRKVLGPDQLVVLRPGVPP